MCCSFEYEMSAIGIPFNVCICPLTMTEHKICVAAQHKLLLQ